MPELPEVESVLRSLRDATPSLVGRRIARVLVEWQGVVSGCSGDELQRRLTGSAIKALSRHGKYLFFGLDGAGRGRYLVLHLRMTGILRLVPSDSPAEPHLRLALELDRNLSLRFHDPRKFGRVWLVEHPSETISSLGPDALGVGYDEFVARSQALRRRLKPLLLDQSFVAGIGNIYADESLHRAGLHPLATLAELSPAQMRRLHGAVVSVLTEAVSANGANIDGVFKAGGFRVRVYAREGQPCFSCGTPIVKIRVSQRGTHLCPRCQRV